MAKNATAMMTHTLMGFTLDENLILISDENEN
jgi:hypothetical protein